MYLSRLQLDPRSKQARIDLASPYELHATLCHAFAGPNQTPPRFLWRAEVGKIPIVLVQSAGMPDWEKLARRFPGYFAQPPASKPIPLEHLQPAQVLRFRLRANPTVTKKDPHNPESKKRKRHGLKTLEEQLEWLHRQGARGGFSVLGAMVVQSERVRMYKHDGSAPIVLQSVLYEGHLKITDLEAFKHTLAAGLGHAKALGFGLLSIAKV
ncbi:MAG: type I-E CRISPR-associated protein Cas6/Cse3/CasE [Meiothermus ruber]|uniref:type I-E CRISPR-associated protein Cas6/Cse3/CasE n=1 Tax=Meiothermus ruber TaxID=277 RepID=UPI0023F65655|nr:type I-E CRISPR-associated protein Cas6/Cse3/CasE [Meiothermus ruber]MCL6529541.1 type I-E CRISPR-associated protein Cas6/Cse3/CasE [Meiothermus ruber]